MIIAICIIAWLLTGFLAAYLGHVFLGKRETELPLGAFLVFVIGGLISFLVVASAIIWDSGFLSFAVFKAKK